ncbi:MAG: hypothetical protein F6J93_15745 [Oscillatoria sp. SIO1A7]|nr:hypothetical protein [Oscillatoria sp. SIO1A7]
MLPFPPGPLVSPNAQCPMPNAQCPMLTRSGYNVLLEKIETSGEVKIAYTWGQH